MSSFRCPLLLPAVLGLFSLVSGAPAHSAESRVSPVYTPVPLTGSVPLTWDSLESDNPMVLPMTGSWQFSITHGEMIDGVYHATPAIANIVSASSEQSWNPATNAIDGDTATVWQAASASLPQWLQVDLGSVRTVSGADITFGENRTDVQYRLEGSTDGVQWSTLSDKSAAPGAGNGPVSFTPAQARYVRITVVDFATAVRRPGSNGGPSASIADLDIDVTGQDGQPVHWHPAADPGADAFVSPSFDSGSWNMVKVPSNWEIAGYSPPTYNSVDDATGLYRRWVTVPASFAGKRIVWRFDGAFDGAEIFVNGVRAGYHESGYTAFDVDLTGLVTPGQKNLFAVRLCKKTPSEDLDTGDYEALGGIYRDTFLYATPQTYIRDLTLTTNVAPDGSASAAIDLEVSGVPGMRVSAVSWFVPAAAGAHLAAAPGPNSAGATSVEATIDADGLAHLPLVLAAPHPLLWSAEKPNLYYAVVELTGAPAARSGPIEIVKQRFGFRQITISPQQVVLWNGVPIKCAGTCRHEIYPTLGAALDDTVWKRDIALIKAANINAIRTSHYNHATRFLDLCEESGFYILDEIPFCWAGDRVNDPRYRDAFLERAAETYARDKNRPEVLAWSCGNESGGGPNAVAVLDYMHSQDPTRPAYISQQWPGLAGESFLDDHYPKPDDFDNVLRSAAGKTPIVFTEQPHVFATIANLDYDPGVAEFWGVPLHKSWETVEKYPTILGSFIWEWQNQPVMTTWSDSAPNHQGPPTLRFENNKGVVDGFRNPKPQWWAVKMTYSPVVVSQTAIAPSGSVAEVRIENRYSFGDLSELKCIATAFAGDRRLSTEVVKVACPPLSSTTMLLHVAAGATSVRLVFLRPDVLLPGSAIHAGLTPEEIASDHAALAAGAAPKFLDVCSVKLDVIGAIPPAPPAPAGDGGPLAAQAATSLSVDELGASDKSQALVVSNKRVFVLFDEATGKIESWTLDGRPVLTGGPSLNLGQTHGFADEYGRNSRGFIGPDNGFKVGKAAFSFQSQGSHILVTATSPIAADSGSPLGSLTVDYDVSPDAQIAVGWTVNWTAADTRAWEDGMTLNVPASLARMSWLREAEFSDYPAGYLGAPEGQCVSTDLSFRSSKRGLNWMALTGADGHGLALLAAGDPLLARATLDPATGIVLYASRNEAVDVELSTPWIADTDITLSAGKPVSGSFMLRAY